MSHFYLFATLIAVVCIRSSTADQPPPNPLTINQCGPAPIDETIAINPCICDCKYEHNATNGLCNEKNMCICYYQGEPEADIPPEVPIVALECPAVLIQCYSDVNPIAKAGFEVGCNLDCMCTHGAPMGGTCDFQKQACFCNYTNVNKATADNAGCPQSFGNQFLLFFKGFLQLVTNCANSPLGAVLSPSCNSLLTYPVVLPGADLTNCISGGSINGLLSMLPAQIQACVAAASLTNLRDILFNSVLASFIPRFNFNPFG